MSAIKFRQISQEAMPRRHYDWKNLNYNATGSKPNNISMNFSQKRESLFSHKLHGVFYT